MSSPHRGHSQSFNARIRSSSGSDPRRAFSGGELPGVSLQVGKIPANSKSSPSLPKRLLNLSCDQSDNLDDLSGKSPSTGKRVVEISDLVKQFEDLLHEFREDPQEHSAMFNVIGPNPWNLGFIQTGPLQKRAIKLLKDFTRSIQLQFPRAYSLEEAMKPPAVRGNLRRCKLCLEHVGQWTQICLIHVSAFCKHDNLEKDIELIISQGGCVNARAFFEVFLPYHEREEQTSVSCSVQPIHLAVHAGNQKGVEVLLRQKAAVESRSTFDAVPDFTPLHLATALWARAGEDALRQHEVVKLLLQSLADPMAVDLSGASCQDLRPVTVGVRRLQPAPVKKGMVVMVDVDRAKEQRLRREAHQFFDAADVRRMEFVVLQDVEDPENEQEQVHVQLITTEFTEEPKHLKLPLSCMEAMGYRFFSWVYHLVLDQIRGMATPPETSPKFARTQSVGQWLEDDASGSAGSMTLQDFRKRRVHTEEVTVDCEEDVFESEVCPETAVEDAVHMKLANPLRPGHFYRKRNRVSSGYALHFAVDELIRFESEAAEEVLRSLIRLRADVHSRATVKRIVSKDSYEVTAIHMAAVSNSLPAVKLLLDVKASIESAATFDNIPCWTPLADALLASLDTHAVVRKQKAHAILAKESVIQYLLMERANPDGCGGSGGLSCLHLAVGKNCDSDVVCLLVENNGDVTSRTSNYVRATRAHGNRGWDRGLTPLQICDYADQVYSQKARSEVMALLAPSLRGASFLLQDVASMSAFSVSAADELVKRVVEESKKDAEGSAARALQTLRLRAITGSRSEEGLTPLDSIAELIEIAPTTAISLLDELLLTEPDTEDPHVHPLPHRANMNYKHRAQGFGWSATIFDLPNLSVQTTYQADCNNDRVDQSECLQSTKRHEEWPCWLRQQRLWHSKLAPKASCTRASLVSPAGLQKSFADHMGTSAARLLHQEGDRDVCIKVLLVANVLDVRVMMALTNVGWSEIFAEKVVQAILSAGYENFCFRPITASLIQETVLFAAFLGWSFGCDLSLFPHTKKICWAAIFAIFLNETITMGWWLRGHLAHNWTLKQFFMHPMTSFRLFQLYLLWWLMWRTFFGYDLDHSWRQDEPSKDNRRTFERSLLGANLLLQCILFIFLAKGASPRLEFGRHLLAILHSFLRLGVIFTVLFLVFASFTSAYLVMGSRLPLRALIEKVYRGLFLADGEGLDVMEGEDAGGLQPNNLDTYLTLLSTFIVTICLLNVSIAVFIMEYEAAIKESWLHFWRWRARLCTEVLLCPRWPWKFESKRSNCIERRLVGRYLEWAVKRLKDDVVPFVYNSRICQRTFNLFGYRISWEPLLPQAVEAEEKDEDAEYVRLVGWMTVAAVTLLGILFLFLPFVHGVFSGILLGVGLTMLKSLHARGPYGNTSLESEASDSDDEEESHHTGRAERPHFLWICYRADYDPNVFMNKEVHKEHLDQLESKVTHLAHSLEKCGHEVTTISEATTKLAEVVQRLEQKMNAPAAGHLGAPMPLDLARSSSSPQGEQRRSSVVAFRRAGSVMSQKT